MSIFPFKILIICYILFFYAAKYSFFLNGFMFPGHNPSFFYLCDVFKKTKGEIKDALEKHPHAKSLSFPVIQQNIEYLLNQGFNTEDIFNVLHIILYSM